MIKVIPLKYYDGGFMTQAFAFGGTRDKEKCEDVKYGSSLQNFLIDDGKEVILSDTGMPNETPAFSKKDDAPLWMGEKVATFKEAFEATGYKVEDVTKIVVTHKHPDHTGELKMFPNAKIYISEREADDMKLTGDNIVRVKCKLTQKENPIDIIVQYLLDKQYRKNIFTQYSKRITVKITKNFFNDFSLVIMTIILDRDNELIEETKMV